LSGWGCWFFPLGVVGCCIYHDNGSAHEQSTREKEQVEGGTGDSPM
jgi:hypothetical protein